jgi:DNA polymerase (family 10)
VDLRAVDDNSFGAALQYFTGSKEHNVKVRSLAIKKGYKLNEYGLYNKENNSFIVGGDEKQIYNKLNLSYIEPELRENRGEIDFAAKNKLPRLLSLEDIKGDLHIHSTWSDGFETIENIANYCKKIGYEYIGITDHSQSLYVAHGLKEERVIKKVKEVKKINRKYSNFRIFCGTECDIKSDGTLDYSDNILKMFDFVGVGIHTNFKMDFKEVTNRIITAMENPYVTFLAHPTCRIIGRREPFEIDIEKIIDKSVETNTLLEINAFPDRLDLNDIHTKIAKENKAKFVIGTDSHYLRHLTYMKFGVAVARRGWLEKKDVINTYSINKLENDFFGE